MSCTLQLVRQLPEDQRVLMQPLDNDLIQHPPDERSRLNDHVQLSGWGIVERESKFFVQTEKSIFQLAHSKFLRSLGSLGSLGHNTGLPLLHACNSATCAGYFGFDLLSVSAFAIL